MPQGRKNLRRLQIGREVTAGTSAAATIRLRFAEAVIEDTLEMQQIDEQVGVLGGVDRTAIVKLGGKISIGSQPVSFEQLPYFLAMTLGGPTTAAASATTASDRVFLVNLPVTTAAVPQTYTFEGGDDFEVERMTYGHGTKLGFEGKGGDVLKMSAEIVGRGVTTASNFATTATLRQVEDIVFSKGKLFLDTISGSFGATQISNQVLGLKLDIEPTYAKKFTADGSLDFSFVSQTEQAVIGSVTFEMDAATTQAKYDWRNQVPKLLRYQVQGTQLTSQGVVTTGTGAYGFKTFRFDLPVKWTMVGKLEEENGNDLVTAEFVSKYNLANTTAGAGTIVVALDANGVTTGALTLP